ncbi:nucleoporin [Flagelloscypha sp. PMI_526]|nr:nucleoporin [Flagelloscypha sp. PMI_526]
MADLGALQSASVAVHEQLAKDATLIPDLAECLTAPGAQASALYSLHPDDTRVPFQKRKLVPLPDALFEHFQRQDPQTCFGLLPEIEKAWISIDEKLFLWDYVQETELNSFLDQPDIISHVALVPAKPGLFIDDISSLLVICTPVSVLLIAISYKPPPPGADRAARNELQMYSTDLSVQTEIEMTSVIGMSDGRIFMRGVQDRNLYELHYQESESWFGKRIQLVNHSMGGVGNILSRFTTASPSCQTDVVSLVSDRARGVFYALTEKPHSIIVFKPGAAKAVQPLQTLSNLYKQAQDKAPGSPALVPDSFEIVSLHVVDPLESRSGIHFMALTSNGVRLYFGPTMSYSFYGTTSSGQSLGLVHVRVPPTDLPHPDDTARSFRPQMSAYGAHVAPLQLRSPPHPIKNIVYSAYTDGLLVAVQKVEGREDFIFCAAPDVARMGNVGVNPPPTIPTTYVMPAYGGHTGARTPLAESASLLQISGEAYAIAPVPRPRPTTPSGTPFLFASNELAMQFSEPPQQFMIFTDSGMSFVVKRRAIDFLKAIFEEVNAHGQTQQIIEFRDSFGRDQTCAMLLGLACGNTYLDCLDGIPPVTLEIANLAKQSFYDMGERPMWAGRMTYGQADAQGTAHFSGRRQGLAIYLARLLRPIWKSKVTRPGANGKQEPVIPDKILVTVQANLVALKDFVDLNPHLFHSSPTDTQAARGGPTEEQEAWKVERKSISELQTLFTRTIEALSFVLLLNDYRLGDLVAKCEQATQNVITNLTYEELVTTQNGMDASRALVNVIIDQQIGQQISVDTVSEILQQRCGSFCSTEDVMLYKAKENLRKAVETKNPVELQHLLSDSLRLFVKAARIMDVEKLREVEGDYQVLGFVQGAIELPLECAKVLDSDGQGHALWIEGGDVNSNDPRTAFLNARQFCYDLVMDSLEVFEAGATSVAGEARRDSAYELAFSAEDELFHSRLYDWLIQRNLSNQLLEIRPAFLEAHLKRPPSTAPKCQLLWQFYVKNGQPLRAAEILAELAESTQFPELQLTDRVECLTLAVGNAKSHPVSLDGHHESAIAFLANLEEKLEVAQVQLQIWDALQVHLSDSVAVAEHISQLTQRLFNISDLYLKFAEAFQLNEMKLLCLYVSEHKDDNVVQPIWSAIIQDAIDQETDLISTANRIAAEVTRLGKKFYPSESAFPRSFITWKLVSFSLEHRAELANGWVPRILTGCGVSFNEVWDDLHDMYERQIPPFNTAANTQAVSADIAVLLSDWVQQARRPMSGARADFPVDRIDTQVGVYIEELDQTKLDTLALYQNVKRDLHRYW